VVDEFDGITIRSSDFVVGDRDNRDWWWFNVRASNTEPLLRLNAEARNESTLAAIRDEVLALIRA
jgi:phosphomannomutase